jgi:D-alanyl-D-alanine carboxypeptidase
MAGHQARGARLVVAVMATLTMLVLAPAAALAAPFAAYVMDARTGNVLYERNADTRLHPASLTKMLTLYIAFDAVRRGEITLDTMVRVSAHAASEPPSRLGLRAGQRISLRHLIRAAAIRSANDAATAIGEAISGSESAFAERMNRTAKAIGMTRSTFRNAHGLTADGHLSTAHDMTILGRRLFYDFPEYYNLFSRRSEDAGIARVANTNRRFLDAYRGADGIKTGYTNAAGFNLTASAERGQRRVIATVFGGTSTAQRNARMAELLDIGFGKAPGSVAERPPAPVALDAIARGNAPAEAVAAATPGAAAKTIRLLRAVAKSPRPRPRPAAEPPEALQVAMDTGIRNVLEVVADATAEEAAADAAAAAAVAAAAAAPQVSPVPAPRPAPAEAVAAAAADPAPAPGPAAAPEPRPEAAPVALAEAAPVPADPPADPPAATPAPAIALAAAPAAPAPASTVAPAVAAVAVAAAPRPEPPRPQARPGEIVMTASARAAPPPAQPAVERGEVVARLSTSGGRHWGVTLGRFGSRDAAERALLQTALKENGTLHGALRKVAQQGGGFDANYLGLTRDEADLACRRLQARAIQCFMLGP